MVGSNRRRDERSRAARFAVSTRPGDLAVIAVGGALGTLARYGMSRLIVVAKGGFPWATFWTNLSGALVIGFFVTIVVEARPPSRYARPFFAVGFLGGYTTFSTMAVETVVLAKDGDALKGIVYIVSSVLAGIVLAYAGVVLARLLTRRLS
jgi:CrcB protein